MRRITIEEEIAAESLFDSGFSVRAVARVLKRNWHSIDRIKRAYDAPESEATQDACPRYHTACPASRDRLDVEAIE